MTKVLPCTCQHPWQDQQYGHGQRVHNSAKGKDGKTVWRCTVCGAVKGADEK